MSDPAAVQGDVNVRIITSKHLSTLTNLKWNLSVNFSNRRTTKQATDVPCAV